MAQSVKPLTLDFSSGYDLMVQGFEPHFRLCAVSNLLKILSLCPPQLLTLKNIKLRKRNGVLSPSSSVCVCVCVCEVLEQEIKTFSILPQHLSPICHWKGKKYIFCS